MNRGPAPGFQRQEMSFADKAVLAWENVPEWVAALASQADKKGLRLVGVDIGYSTTAVSTTINAKYAGDIGRVEQAVRGAYMGSTVDCPILNLIGRERCLSEQKAPFRGSSRERVLLYHACRQGCPHSLISGGDDEQ